MHYLLLEFVRGFRAATTMCSWKRHIFSLVAALCVCWWVSSYVSPRTTFQIPNLRKDRMSTSLRLSSRGKYLATLNYATSWAGDDKPEASIQMWDLGRNKRCWSLVINDEDNWRYGVFSPDENFFVVRTSKGVRIWDCQTGTILNEYPLEAKTTRWHTPLAYTKEGKLVAFRMEDNEETTVYEVASGAALHRLPKGGVTPLMSDIALHSFEGKLRLFRLGEGLDISKPYLQNRFEQVKYDKNGELQSSSRRGHEYHGCTHDGTILFGTYHIGGMTSPMYYFYTDYSRDFTEDLEDGWHWDTLLRPSWTGRYLARTEQDFVPTWLAELVPPIFNKSLILRDYRSGRAIVSVSGGKAASFSLDDCVMATCTGAGRVQIWDLPPYPPWWLMAASGFITWAVLFVVTTWFVTKKRSAPSSSPAA